MRKRNTQVPEKYKINYYLFPFQYSTPLKGDENPMQLCTKQTSGRPRDAD